MYYNILNDGSIVVCSKDFGNGVYIENYSVNEYYYMENGEVKRIKKHNSFDNDEISVSNLNFKSLISEAMNKI